MPKQALLNNQAHFLRRIASEIEESSRPIRVQADEVLDPGEVIELTLDDAVQRAEALWMSGYTWEEIETRLVNMEFSEGTARKAVEKTKEYAKEKLNTGPFATPLVEEQTARLKSGKIVRLCSISPHNATVREDGEEYIIETNQIDVKASLQLKEAYLMRSMARRMVMDAQKKYTGPDIEAIPTAPEMPETKAIPTIDEKYDVKFMKKSPEGLTELTPESGEAQRLPEELERIVNDIEGLEAMKDEVQEKTKEIREKQLNPLQQQFKELSADEQAAARSAFLVSNQIMQGIEGLDTVVFGDYKDQVVAFRIKMVEEEKQPGVVEELDALKKILTENHPKIAKDVLAALETYKRANSVIERRVEHTLYKYPHRKHPLKKKESLDQTAQMFEKVKKFFKAIVDKVKSVTDKLFDSTLPMAAEVTDELAAFNKKASVNKTNVRVSAAVENILRRR
jgi:hypothetical protein